MVNNSPQKAVIIIFSILCIISCKKKCEDEEGLLTADELSWFSYAEGQTLIFKSNGNELDTFTVSAKTTYDTPVSHGSSGSCDPRQQSMFYVIKDNYLTGFNVSSYHNNEHTPDGRAFIITTDAVFNFTDFSPQNNILVNGNTYNDVYIMKTDTVNYDPRIWCIYYTKQNGILRYDLTNGGGQWEKIN
ncbi:MAG: hypothetical protein ABI772_09675 [Bacteroidota bacterium]